MATGKQKNSLTLNEISAHFNPAWFAVIMGTAVIPLAISFIKHPATTAVAGFFFVLSIVLFIAALIPWALKFIRHFQAIKHDLNHPIAGNFLPTMPISLIVLSLIFLKYPTMLFSKSVSLEIAYYLWLLGSFGIYLMGFIILIYIFRHKEIDLVHANFGWYIPPVSKLIIPVAGFELTQVYPHFAEFNFTLSIVSFGVGFFLFLFVGAAVYHRYIYHELPMSQFAATFFIGIAPTAIVAVILFKMMHLFEHNAILGIDPHIFSSIAKIGILVNWGLSVWWFIMALIIILYYIRKIELPYALSWWAFTFPSGALAVSSGIAWKITNFSFIGSFYYLSVGFILFVWTIVFVKTLKGIISGKIFLPSH
jgi:C4-dicarboxylate transporter/malic acid transport protein